MSPHFKYTYHSKFETRGFFYTGRQIRELLNHSVTIKTSVIKCYKPHDQPQTYAPHSAGNPRRLTQSIPTYRPYSLAVLSIYNHRTQCVVVMRKLLRLREHVSWVKKKIHDICAKVNNLQYDLRKNLFSLPARKSNNSDYSKKKNNAVKFSLQEYNIKTFN